jgi:carbamoyl-phosphate synthase large subunit
VLVNSNPATIMTDPQMADATYIEPLTPEIVEENYRTRETGRPAADRRRADRSQSGDETGRKRGARPSMAFRLIGASPKAIALAEDRELFKRAMIDAGLRVPLGETVSTVEQAVDVASTDRVSGAGAPFVHPWRQRRRCGIQ